MASGSIRGITIEIEGKTSGLVKSLDAVNKNLKTTQSNLKMVEKALKLDPKNLDTLKQKQGLLNTAIEQTKEKLELEKQAAEDAAKALAEGTITQGQYDALQAEVTKTTAELQNLENEAGKMKEAIASSSQLAARAVEELGKSITDVGSKMQDVGDKMEKVGTKMTKTLTVPIVGAGAASVNAAMDFETAMAKVSTIADETQVSYEDMEKAILQLSDTTGIASTDIAESVYNAISAGQQTGDAVNFVTNATMLAKAGFADTGQALDLLTTIMNSYGLESNQVSKISDNLIMTQNLGKTTVAELSTAMGKAIPTAKAVGVNIDELCGSYAIMTSNGIATAETTTYLNSMLNELGKKGTTAAKAFAEGTKHIKEGGLSMKEAMDMGWSLTDVLSVLDEQAASSGTSINNMFGSAEAGKAAAVLWDNAGKLNDAITQMEGSANATQVAFDKMDSTKAAELQKTLNQVKNTAVELGNSILTTLAPVLRDITEKVKSACDWFKGLNDTQKNSVVQIGLVVAALGPVITIISKLIFNIGTITKTIGGLVTFIGSTLMPLISTVVTYITGTLIPAIAAIGAPIIAVIAAITAIIVVIKNWQSIVELFQIIWEGFKQAVVTIATAIKDGVINAFNALSSMVSSIFSGISNIATSIWNAISSFVTTTVTNIKETAVNIFTSLKDGISTIIGDVKTAIVDGLNAAFDFIKAIPAQAVQWGKDMIQGLIDGIKSMIGAVGDAVKGVADKITSWLHFSRPDVGPLRNYETWMPDMMQGLAKGITSNIDVLDRALSQVSNTMSMKLMQTDYSPALAGINKSISSLSFSTGDTIIPISIGNERLDTLVVKANDKFNYRSGGR